MEGSSELYMYAYMPNYAENSCSLPRKACGKEEMQKNQLMIVGGKYDYLGPFTAGIFENVDVARKMHVTAPTTVRVSSDAAHSS